MAKTNYITNWKDWKELCQNYDRDPYTTIEFRIDNGEGNLLSANFEYTGNIPKYKEE